MGALKLRDIVTGSGSPQILLVKMSDHVVNIDNRLSEVNMDNIDQPLPPSMGNKAEVTSNPIASKGAKFGHRAPRASALASGDPGRRASSQIAFSDPEVRKTFTSSMVGGDRRASSMLSRYEEVDPALNRTATKIAHADVAHMERRSTLAGVDMTGLTSKEAEDAIELWGWNEVQEQEVSIWWMFIKQFIGMMPGCIAFCFVLALAAADYIDAIIVGVLMIVNGVVGFKEEFEAYTKLQELIDSDVKTVRVKRDGKFWFELNDHGEKIGRPLRDLVPGDVVSIKIGDVVPADCVILEGNIKMDTKAVTGEPIPWKVPRETPAQPGNPNAESQRERDGYEVDQLGSELWGGCDVVQGECVARVIRTGPITIVGEVNAALAESSTPRKSDFEEKILFAVKIIISVAAILSIMFFFIQLSVRNQTWETALKAVIAVLIGSVPVALPLVLLVTMATGSVIMSNEKALVSDLAALQDIASMTCLNSDKTGTLTTAVMDIIVPSLHAEEGYETKDVLEMAVVCSNRANTDDAIDGAIVRKWDKQHGGDDKGEALIEKKWKVIETKGFNNAAKRVECTAKNRETGKTVTIVKGLIGKCLKNDADPEEAEDQSHTPFEVKGYASLAARVEKQDAQLAIDGYKTIGLTVRWSEDGPFEFVGIIPMLDPPRDDAAMCIRLIREAGVRVKMVTGDHCNIAKTTAGIIGLGTNILPNSVFSQNSGAQLNHQILEADGFAQVFPKDKETVVLEEQDAGWIVGFCGDGMNDALALKQAQVGIAVADAMDAAIKASSIQLLDPGLGCIYTAIVESRKIFRRVKSYVVYRFAATIQLIIFLSITLFVAGCQIDLIYIVMLALLNDITMMPLSGDRQRASNVPDQPNVWRILLQSFLLGSLQALISVGWFYVGSYSDNGTDLMHTVKDSSHIQPELWNSYLYSSGGTTGDMPKKYHECLTVTCPTFKCSTSNNGALLEVSCTGACADDYSPGLANYTHFCAEDNGISEYQTLPAWQECCVTYADLVHPGQPHAGTATSACSEITTASVFIQILVASEFMIFPVRALGWMFMNRASTSLYVAVIGTCVVFSILAAEGVPKNLGPLGDIFAQELGSRNTGYVWLWSLGATLIMDLVKYAWVLAVDGTTEEIEVERVEDAMKMPEYTETMAGAHDSLINRYTAKALANRTGGLPGGLQIGPANIRTSKHPGAMAGSLDRAFKQRGNHVDGRYTTR